MIRRRSTVALFPAALALLLPVSAATTLLLPLTAAPASAQDFPEESTWPAGECRTLGIKMPKRATRLASGSIAYPQGVVEKMVAAGKAGGMQVDRREEFFWTLLTPTRLRAERDAFHKALTAAGYVLKPMGEEDHPDEHVIFFLAQKKGASGGNATVPGFWSVGKEFQALVLGAAPGVLGPKVVPKVYTEKQKLGFALIDAVEEKRVDAVETLLAKGADPNARSKNDQTPLMRAAMVDRPDLAEILLKAGADPNVTTKDMSPLQIAAMSQQVSLMEMLLRHKADINWATPADGVTALHVAAMLGKERSVDLLLEKGADTTLRTKDDGRTAGEKARRNGHVGIAEKIEAAGKKG